MKEYEVLALPTESPNSQSTINLRPPIPKHFQKVTLSGVTTDKRDHVGRCLDLLCDFLIRNHVI